ncbi:sigma-70 family RNA polymerase sigma factor [Fulvivirga sp. M361]|uniref:RNA polymerase sigma factor n=1 Tax=Fulvivirga sp. M361 TaxID=2594266 RepID=UPI00117B971F|nr:sigma-70 family RNA polymerase sigma factor [Fulvivirga sp. M361]TRX61194.1 sigma-70 family RNA polymerase sigma factor [Fulvivirga sp. M361]
MKKKAEKRKVKKLAPESKSHIKEEENFLLWYFFSKGDHRATSYIYKTYRAKLLEYGRQFAEPERVKDCIQEVFLDLMKKRIKPEQPASIQGYLNACLKHKLLRKVKRDGMEFTESRLDNSNGNNHALAMSKHAHEVDWTLPGQDSQLSRAFKELPFRYRKALLLHYIKNKSHKEVAKLMRLNTEEAARSVVYRGKEQLKKLLRKMEAQMEKVVH